MTDKHTVVPRADQAAPHSIMHPLVEKMLGTNPTPEALEKVLALQREWEKGEAKRAYTAALVELKRALPPFLKRDKTVDFTGQSGKRTTYTHTSLAGAMETIQPHLSEFGFSLTWRPGTNDKGGVTVTAVLTHRLGHSEEATLTAPPDVSGNKSSAQGIASTITLLQRYSALAILGLATADMTEPTGEAPAHDTDRVDTSRNMKAMSGLVKAGKTKEAAETYVGRPVKEWTSKDLDKLRAWIAPEPEPEEWRGQILEVLVAKKAKASDPERFIVKTEKISFSTTERVTATRAKTLMDTGEHVLIRYRPGVNGPEIVLMAPAEQPPE